MSHKVICVCVHNLSTPYTLNKLFYNSCVKLQLYHRRNGFKNVILCYKVSQFNLY